MKVVFIRSLMFAALAATVHPIPAANAAELPADQLIQGIPPAPETRVTKANWFIGPYNR